MFLFLVFNLINYDILNMIYILLKCFYYLSFFLAPTFGKRKHYVAAHITKQNTFSIINMLTQLNTKQMSGAERK